MSIDYVQGVSRDGHLVWLDQNLNGIVRSYKRTNENSYRFIELTDQSIFLASIYLSTGIIPIGDSIFFFGEIINLRPLFLVKIYLPFK